MASAIEKLDNICELMGSDTETIIVLRKREIDKIFDELNVLTPSAWGEYVPSSNPFKVRSVQRGGKWIGFMSTKTARKIMKKFL